MPTHQPFSLNWQSFYHMLFALARQNFVKVKGNSCIWGAGKRQNFKSNGSVFKKMSMDITRFQKTGMVSPDYPPRITSAFSVKKLSLILIVIFYSPDFLFLGLKTLYSKVLNLPSENSPLSSSGHLTLGREPSP